MITVGRWPILSIIVMSTLQHAGSTKRLRTYVTRALNVTHYFLYCPILFCVIVSKTFSKVQKVE